MDARNEGAGVLSLDAGAITVDSPVPYKLATLRAKIEADKARTEGKPKETGEEMQERIEARREEISEGAPASESDPPHTDDVPTSEMTPEKFAESLRAETHL